MSKLNPLLRPESKFDSHVKLAGGAGLSAAKQGNVALLRRAVLANLLWENNCYIEGTAVADSIALLIPRCEPEAVANIAMEARIVQKLRHTPLFIVAQMSKHPEHNRLISQILPSIITRADMLTDFLAIYSKVRGSLKPLTGQVKRGLALSFNNFNEYQFAKYDRNAAYKICDVMALCHPNPKGREDLYKRIADRKLATPDTWEVALSTGKDKKATWERLIAERKLGGLAMLRNISNMVKADVGHNSISQGLKELKGHMLLPLNFYSAAKANPHFAGMIEQSMINCYKNIDKLPGSTLFIVDISGSMSAKISSKSDLTRMEVASMMAMLAANQCERFELVATAGSDRNPKGSESAHVHIKYPMQGFGIIKQISDCQYKTGRWGIFTRQCLEWCYENVGKNFDRIIIFSDSQDQDKVNKVPNPYGTYNYICDVSSEERGINFKGKWTAEISGWSEHFLTYIAAIEGIENSFESTEE